MLAKTLGDVQAEVNELVKKWGADAPMYSLSDNEISDGAVVYFERIEGFRVPYPQYDGHDMFVTASDLVTAVAEMEAEYSDVIPILGFVIEGET
jgi:hypothetical protein